MAARIWIDGRFAPADVPQLSIADRGFQLGDGVFETLRSRKGWVVELADHLDRLRESAAAVSIPLPDDIRQQLEAAIEELLEANDLAAADAALRITVSRGAIAGRGMLPTGWQDARPTIAIQAWPYYPPPPVLLERGVRAITTTLRHDPGSRLAGVKTTSRADHVVARLEAEFAAVEDAIFLTVDGRVSEATSANVFAVVGADLATPPRSAAILSGTTRSWLLGHAATEGLRPVERDLVPDDLWSADEVFLSSSVAGILPLVELDRRPIGGGRPGPRTLALRVARERWIDEHAEAAWTAPR
jgi:branched-chain amino acid aminotransferase